MPWVIPPWLDLVEFFGLTAKEYDKHADDKAMTSTMTAMTATATAAMPTTGMAATMATTTNVTWMLMAVGTKTTTTITSMTMMMTMRRWQCDGEDDDGTTTIWWRWACERYPTHPRQPSTYVGSLGRSRQERERILEDGSTDKGRGGSDLMEITSSPLDQFQINFPHTPEWQTHGILFHMCPGGCGKAEHL